MRVFPLLWLALVASAAATSVREYRHDEWKAIVTVRPKPEYPFEARRSRMQGQGQFRLHFARDGHVTAVEVLKSTGHQMLDDATRKAFGQWHATAGPRRELDVPISFQLSPGRYPPPRAKLPETILREFSS